MYSNQFEHHIYTIHLFIRNFAKQIYSKNNAQTQNNRNATSVSRRVSRGEQVAAHRGARRRALAPQRRFGVPFLRRFPRRSRLPLRHHRYPAPPRDTQDGTRRRGLRGLALLRDGYRGGG